ncbi:microfibril-associated glycoprotein 4 isoform X1 [Labeo rohita]|nr:microfibril-associated glycoprotein 4 isoform X1 [Labeo rohita]
MYMMMFLAAFLPVLLGSGSALTPFDCSDIQNSGETLSGIYAIYPAGDIPVWVYCHIVSDGTVEDNGGWTVIQRRVDGSMNFYQPWNQYKRGFGNVETEYWLGLENMFQLTRNRAYMLRVDLEDFNGRKGYALYSSFSVGAEVDGYKLQVSGFADGGAGDSLTFHNGLKFTTFDKDQDIDDNNCAKMRLGGFWYRATPCHYTNPNGIYLWGRDATIFGIGNAWYTWENSVAVGMKTISMKIKPVS